MPPSPKCGEAAIAEVDLSDQPMWNVVVTIVASARGAAMLVCVLGSISCYEVAKTWRLKKV